ncbi:hypothetical protein BS47DRAFT_1368009 [Hydnum rufescens UP504]|uniref:DNA 3'-5' helicase n=1 Tax=Hydnum rufescens UP504 TaxID=1448309 RepID=A0A9P6DNR4_9AGAM|nr:hypothetical protein BS47DRAFT_1368009 [Hydnum rufescens UP504]
MKQCREPGCGAELQDSRGLDEHRREMHQKKLKIAGFGVRTRHSSGLFLCDIQGCDFFATTSAMRSHILRKHQDQAISVESTELSVLPAAQSQSSSRRVSPDLDGDDNLISGQYGSDPAGRGNISFNDELSFPGDVFLEDEGDTLLRSSEERETIFHYAQDLETPDGFLYCQLGIDTSNKVVRDTILGHFVKHHGGTSSLPPNLVNILDGLGIPPVISRPDCIVAPIQGIPTLSGFYCRKCYFAAPARKTVANHVYTCRPGVPANDNIQQGKVQVVFCSPTQTWAVEPHYSTTPFLKNAQMQNAVEDAANNYEHPLVPHSFSPPENSRAVAQYIKELGWADELEGHSPKELMELGALPRKEEEDFFRLKLGMESYFDRMKSVVGGMEPVVKRWVQTSSGHTVGHEPFKYPENAKSVHKYADYASRLAIFILRISRCIASGSPTIPILLSSVQLSSAAALDQALHCQGAESDGCGQLDGCIQRFFENILFSRHPHSSQHSNWCPVIRFLLVTHIVDAHGNFRSPKELCGNISALHFLFRLVFLLQVHQIAQTRGVPDAQNEVCTELRSRWLIEGQPSPYDSMLSIMHYATTVSYHQTTPPSFTISSDHALVSIGPHHVHLKDLPVMYQGLIGEMKTLLGELTEGLEIALPLEHMEDDLTQHGHNYSFVEENQHILHPCFLAALNRVHSAPFVLRQQVDGQIVWNRHVLHGYMARAQKLNSVIMLLVYMSSQPPRITELMSMLITNDANSVRSLFLLPDGMVAMLSYNKTNSKNRSEKLIPRYLHPDFQHLLMQYLVFVRPIEFHFSKEIWGDGAARLIRHNLFYRPGGKVYQDSAQFSEQILAPATLKYLGTKITASDWRQLCAGLGREFGASLIDPSKWETGMDMLAGRSTAVSVHNYAVSTGSLSGHLTPDRLQIYYFNCKLWWSSMYNLAVEGPTVPLKDLEDPDFDIATLTRTTLAPMIPGGPGLERDHQNWKQELLGDIQKHISQAVSSALSKLVPELSKLIKEEAVHAAMSKNKALLSSSTSSSSGRMLSLTPSGLSLKSSSFSSMDTCSISLATGDQSAKNSTTSAEILSGSSMSWEPSEPRTPEPTNGDPGVRMDIDGGPGEAHRKETEEAMQVAAQAPDGLPEEVDIRSLRHLQKVLRDKKGRFRSLMQYHATWALQKRRHHLLLISPPGSGKTLPFQVTMSTWPENVRAILVEPYSLLYQQMKDRMTASGLSASVISKENLGPSSGRVVIVGINYFSNRTFLDWMKGLASSSQLGMVAFDEIHTMAEDDDYRPLYKTAVKNVLELPNINMLLMTGTAPPLHMGQLWNKLDLFPEQMLQFRTLRSPSIHRPNIQYQTFYANSASSHNKNRLVAIVESLEHGLLAGQCGAVFFNSKENCKRFAAEIGCEAITGDTAPGDRPQVYARWKERRILCMNKAGYYGGDIAGVTFVVHAEPPQGLTDYLQSSGRGGRSGEECLSLIVVPFDIGPGPDNGRETFSGKHSMHEMLVDRSMMWIVACCKRDIQDCFYVLAASKGLRRICFKARINLFNDLDLDSDCIRKDSRLGTGHMPDGNNSGHVSVQDQRFLPKVSMGIQIGQGISAQRISEQRQRLDTVLSIMGALQDVKCFSCWRVGDPCFDHDTSRCPVKGRWEYYVKFSKEEAPAGLNPKAYNGALQYKLNHGGWRKYVWPMEEHAYCWRCLFHLDHPRFHAGTAGIGEKPPCCFPDVVAPIAWIVRSNKGLLGCLARDLGHPELEKPKSFDQWLSCLDEGQRKVTVASTHLIIWFYRKHCGCVEYKRRCALVKGTLANISHDVEELNKATGEYRAAGYVPSLRVLLGIFPTVVAGFIKQGASALIEGTLGNISHGNMGSILGVPSLRVLQAYLAQHGDLHGLCKGSEKCRKDERRWRQSSLIRGMFREKCCGGQEKRLRALIRTQLRWHGVMDAAECTGPGKWCTGTFYVGTGGLMQALPRNCLDYKVWHYGRLDSYEGGKRIFVGRKLSSVVCWHWDVWTGTKWGRIM